MARMYQGGIALVNQKCPFNSRKQLENELLVTSPPDLECTVLAVDKEMLFSGIHLLSDQLLFIVMRMGISTEQPKTMQFCS